MRNTDYTLLIRNWNKPFALLSNSLASCANDYEGKRKQQDEFCTTADATIIIFIISDSK